MGQSSEGTGVVRRTGDSLFKNGRIRSHAAESIVVDQILQLARHDHAALHIIVPYTLAILLQVYEGIGHGCSSLQRWRRDSEEKLGINCGKYEDWAYAEQILKKKGL